MGFSMNDKIGDKFVTDRQTIILSFFYCNLYIFSLLQKYILHILNFVLTLYNLLGINSRLVINKNFNIFIEGVSYEI